jgi:hypothetical protein
MRLITLDIRVCVSAIFMLHCAPRCFTEALPVHRAATPLGRRVAPPVPLRALVSGMAGCLDARATLVFCEQATASAKNSELSKFPRVLHVSTIAHVLTPNSAASHIASKYIAA